MNVETINFGQHAKIKIKATIKDPEDPDTIFIGLYSDIHVIEVRYLDGKIVLIHYKRDYETNDFEILQTVEINGIGVNTDVNAELELKPRLRQIIKAIVEGKPIKNTYVATVTINNSIQKTIELDITDLTTQFETRTCNIEVQEMEISKEC